MAAWPPMSSDALFQPGQTISGMWNGKRYTALHLLGRGANGEVYRVTDARGQTFALKASRQASEIALEHKILKQLQGVAQGVDLGPLVFDLDDMQLGNGKVFFYVMEWVKGTGLADFLERRGPHWLVPLLLQLCKYLEPLHEMGYCFGDLKAENCLVDSERGVLRLVDFGGVTPHGRGVKEYTEWYDRAWWGQGKRVAEPAYDVFALSMMVVAMVAPDLCKAVKQSGKTPNFLWMHQALASEPRLQVWKGLLEGVWSGRIQTAAQFRQALMPLVDRSIQAEKQRRQKRRKRDWTDWLLIGMGSVLILVFCQYLFFRL